MTFLKENLLHVFIFSALFFREILLSVFTAKYDGFLLCLLFSVALSFFLAFLISIFNNKKLRFSFLLVLDSVAFLLFLTETLLYRSFGYFYTPETIMDMGGDVAGSFGSAVIEAIYYSVFIIILNLIPTALLILFKDPITNVRKGGRKSAAIFLVLSVLFHFVSYTAVVSDKSSPVTARELYTTEFDFNAGVPVFGLLTSLRLNTEYSVSGIPEKKNAFKENFTENTPVSKTKEYNVSKIDLKRLKSDFPEISSLCDILLSLSPTEKNEYTGFFKDKNLIFICAEAFSPYAIDPKYTPTLYKLSNSGFVFENYYQPSFGESTSGGEYSLLLGQVPKRDSGESGLSMKITCKENLEYSMPGLFNKSGYTTRGFHNNSYTYYQRNVTHPKMKMDWYGVGGSINGLYGTELDISSALSPGWPHSDKELFESVIPVITQTDTPSFSYILTCSGHNNYSFSENAMARKNREIYENTAHSEKIKAYLSSQYELESALSALIEGLESSGKLSDTVIALSNDHYPYGLSASWQGNGGISYTDELYGKQVTSSAELEKGCFFIWSAEMDKPVTVSKPVSSFDVLPTLLNLFGIDYDSRFLAGRDVFAGKEGLAFFSDGSFVSEKGTYNAKKRAFSENAPVCEEYVSETVSEIKMRINLSKQIRKKDFFRYIV